MTKRQNSKQAKSKASQQAETDANAGQAASGESEALAAQGESAEQAESSEPQGVQPNSVASTAAGDSDTQDGEAEIVAVRVLSRCRVAGEMRDANAVAHASADEVASLEAAGMVDSSESAVAAVS